jgi:predicted aspartyl protease
VGEDSTQWEAWGALIRIQTQTGRTTVARVTLERARRAGLPRPTLRAHEALMAALSGDSEAARRALVEVPETAIRDDPTLADVVRVVQELLARSP